MMPDDSSRDEQVTGPDIVTSPTLQEETPIIISENDDQENDNEKNEVITSTVESEEEEGIRGVCLFVEQVVLNVYLTGGEVQVAPHQCTEFTGFHRPGEDHDTDTAPVKPIPDFDDDLPEYILPNHLTRSVVAAGYSTFHESLSSQLPGEDCEMDTTSPSLGCLRAPLCYGLNFCRQSWSVSHTRPGLLILTLTVEREHHLISFIYVVYHSIDIYDHSLSVDAALAYVHMISVLFREL